MDEYTCDDMYHDVAHVGEHVGGPIVGTLSAGVLTTALLENPPAAGAETGRGGVDIALAYSGGYELGHQAGGPILGGLAWAACEPAELGEHAGQAIAHEWNHLFHPDPPPEPAPAPTPPAWSPDSAAAAPDHSSVFASPDFSHPGVDFSHSGVDFSHMGSDFSHIEHFASPDFSTHSASDVGGHAGHDASAPSHDSPGSMGGSMGG